MRTRASIRAGDGKFLSARDLVREQTYHRG